jgi:hypothetical protein
MSMLRYTEIIEGLNTKLSQPISIKVNFGSHAGTRGDVASSVGKGDLKKASNGNS